MVASISRMSHVLTFVASDYSLLDLMRATHRVLGEQRAKIERIDWLSPGRACDVFFSGAAPADVETAVRKVVGSATVDLAVQPAAGRRKKLLLADMESTVIHNEMLEELADYVGLRAQVEKITTRAMNGELDFRAALLERVALLRGLPETVLGECREAIRFDSGARTLVATLRDHGVHCVLVTGGFTCFADWVAERVGFEACRANLLELDGSGASRVLAGTVAEPILGKEAKLAALEELCAELGISPKRWRRWATAPTTCRCSRPPASGSPSTASRRWPPPPASGSTTATSRPCFISKATAGASSPASIPSPAEPMRKRR